MTKIHKDWETIEQDLPIRRTHRNPKRRAWKTQSTRGQDLEKQTKLTINQPGTGKLETGKPNIPPQVSGLKPPPSAKLLHPRRPIHRQTEEGSAGDSGDFGGFGMGVMRAAFSASVKDQDPTSFWCFGHPTEQVIQLILFGESSLSRQLFNGLGYRSGRGKENSPRRLDRHPNFSSISF